MNQAIKIIECPRDAMQGITRQIPTALKIAYINRLMKVGFDTIDFGSFVSPKAVPQMADTAEVLAGLDLAASESKLLAIVANMRGATDACSHPEIHYLGYPFSISETFQIRNTRKTIAESMELVNRIQELCEQHDKELVVYISMAFGNPYGDEWSADVAIKWVEKMVDTGIKTISLADTVGTADVDSIEYLFGHLLAEFPDVEFGAHFHSTPQKRIEKIQAAWEQGCRRFDTALKGFGGCPFAKDDLVGNIATESLLAFCLENGIQTKTDKEQLRLAGDIAVRVFN